MRFMNSNNRYGLVAILLHWVMALIIIGMLIVGLYMVRLPVGLEKLKLYGWHKQVGFIVLFLASVRLLWRLINLTPKLSIPWYEKAAARLVHWSFYGFMFAMPLTGWLLTSAAGLSVSFFGLFTIPALIGPNEHLRVVFGQTHEYIAYALMVTIILHTAAAFKHHIIDKDDILERMIS